MAVQIQLRHDTAANWTSANPTLAVGEIGVETDTLKVKIGDGSTVWASLSYGLAASIPAHTPFGTPTATVSGILTLPANCWTIKATGTEDFQGMSPGSLTPGDIFYLKLSAARTVKHMASVSAPAVPFSFGNIAQDFGALSANARLTLQLGEGGTQWDVLAIIQ